MHGYKPHPDSFGYNEEDTKWHPKYSHLSPEYKSTAFTNAFFFCRNKQHDKKAYKHNTWMIAPARRVINPDNRKQYFTVLASSPKGTDSFSSGYIRGNDRGWFASRRAAERFAAEIRSGMHPKIMKDSAEWDAECAEWNSFYDDSYYYEPTPYDDSYYYEPTPYDE